MAKFFQFIGIAFCIYLAACFGVFTIIASICLSILTAIAS